MLPGGGVPGLFARRRCPPSPGGHPRRGGCRHGYGFAASHPAQPPAVPAAIGLASGGLGRRLDAGPHAAGRRPVGPGGDDRSRAGPGGAADPHPRVQSGDVSGSGAPVAIEAVTNADPGPAKGRELEFADLLGVAEAPRGAQRGVVHRRRALHRRALLRPHPGHVPGFRRLLGVRLRSRRHAGSSGPNRLDATFSAQVRFQKTPPEGQANLPPTAGFQFFGRPGSAPPPRP